MYWTSKNDITAGVDITWYEDLRKLNATCSPEDTCLVPRTEDSPGILWSHSCSCDRLCSLFDTCCVDSRYKSITRSELKPNCRKLRLSFSGVSYFMIDKCPSDPIKDSDWNKLCADEWNGESDVMRLVPVTSLFTSLTYKNYFCFRCHETTNEFLYWNIFLQSNFSCDGQLGIKHESLTYNKPTQTWTVPLNFNDIWVVVDLRLQIPEEIWSLPVKCESDVISHCNRKWYDDVIKQKCHSYTAILYVQKNGYALKYKNAHCALCNFESLSRKLCKSQYTGTTDSDIGGLVGGNIGPGQFDDLWAYYNATKTTRTEERKFSFSFTHLLDINRSRGEKVGKIRACEGNFLWDPFARRCRKLTCALPGFQIRNGKCIPRIETTVTPAY